MIVNEDQASGQFMVKAFKPGEIRVNDLFYHTSIIVSADLLISDWGPTRLSDISENSWDPILKIKPDILIFGTGEKFTLPIPSFFAKLYEAKIAVEVMDSAAACRTLMALMSENRNVTAAILIL